MKACNSFNRSRLIQSRFRCAHIKTLSYIKLSHLCIVSFGIRLVIFFEILCSRFIILATILSHSQHIQAFLSILGTFLQSNKFLQQCHCTNIFTFYKTFFGIFILVLIIVGSVHLIKFLRTTRKQQHKSRYYKKGFLHCFNWFQVAKVHIFHL